MKKVLVIIAVLVGIGTFAASLTDYACMQDCLDKGYAYRLCKNMCSY